MPVIADDKKKEIKVSSDVVNVSGTSPTVIYQCYPPYEKFVASKILIYNDDSAEHVVYIGEYNVSTAAWVRDIYPIKVAAGQMLILTSDELPEDFVITEDPENAVKAWAAKLDAAASSPVQVKMGYVLY